MKSIFLYSSSIFFLTLIKEGILEVDEAKGKAFLENLETEVGPLCHKRALSEWNFHTNLTDYNRKQSLEFTLEYSKFWRRIWEETRKYKWRSFKDPDIRRQFNLMSTLGTSILPDNLLERYNMIKQSMESSFGKASVCDFYNRTKCDLSLEPEITDIFTSSRNPTELEHLWFEWRNVTGRVLRKSYLEFISLIQTVAKANNYNSATEYELRAYQTETLSTLDFRREIDSLWEILKPFYEELHAYVRFKLRNFYGEDVVPREGGTIPAHLLGNIYAETWENIEDVVIPYKNMQNFNVSSKMQNMGITPIDMVKMGERFFVSLGFPKLDPEFWKNSIFEKPKDRDIICHASAWDLCRKNDFRIKQCTTITETDLLTLHHELGHIYYQMSYNHLPKIYRDGANPAFHEAIGDLIALSVQTPTHMESIGLLDQFDYDHEMEINYLLRVALVKIAFLPYGYLLDKWKWEVAYVNDTETLTSLNCQWWKLRETHQGISRPGNVPAGEEFLDPLSKFHVVSNVAYVRYFISMILQFQLHEALCNEAGNTKPLYLCDIYNSTKAGRKLKNLLSMGASRPWPEVLEVVTGTQHLSATSMLKYFEPLYKWLKSENRRNGEIPGWKVNTQCSSSPWNLPLIFSAYVLWGLSISFVLII